MAQARILTGSGAEPVTPVVRRIAPADLIDALARGLQDFAAMPTHAVFLCLIYPVLGIVLAGLTLGFSIVPLLFPLAAGFALIGPVAALGLYEMSRRREAGLEVSATDAFEVWFSPSISAVLALGGILMILFLIWVATAQAIYISYFGYAPPTSIGQFVNDVLFTRAGWGMIVVGNLVGFLFAVVVLLISAVSFPLLLDRDVGAVVAMHTSIRAALTNPIPMALWGLIVAGLLLVGSLPFFLGLTVVLPVLGHATWHLYRKLVEPDPNPRPVYRRPPQGPRYAAQFPASLFPWTREH